MWMVRGLMRYAIGPREVIVSDGYDGRDFKWRAGNDVWMDL